MIKHLLAPVLLASLAGTANAQVFGFVMDSVTGNPIEGAIVTLATTTTRTTTAIDGSFALLGAVGTNIEIVAAKKGYYNEPAFVTTPIGNVHISLEPVVLGTNTGYAFLDPLTCSACHFEQYDQWVNSPMGKTGSNAWVYDLANGTGTPGGMNGFVYTRDSLHLGFNPTGSCAACHQPENWITNQGIALEEPIDQLTIQAAHGVSCEVCHKMANIDENFLNTLGPTLPSVEFNLPNDSFNEQVEYGILGDVSFEAPGLMRASYQPQIVAEMCASCHQYSNDHDEDGDHEEASSPEGQATYEEWANSPYGDPNDPMFQTCVDCHMPPSGSVDVCSLGLPPRMPDQVRNHNIVGTTPEFLENAVDLVMNVVDNGATLDVQVDITNSMAGHKVPTGVTPRNMILIVEAWRVEDGQMLTETLGQAVDVYGGSGPRIFGNYEGTPGKTFAKISLNSLGQHAPIFTEAETLQYDSRIAPLATDTTNYSFQVPAGSGALKVRSRLIYRRAFKYVVDAKGWTKTGTGGTLPDTQQPYYGHLMEESEWDNGVGPAPIERFGTGCSGLTIDALGDPELGNLDFGFKLSGAIPLNGAFLFLGFSNTVDPSIGALPFDLTPVGATNCSIQVSTQGLFQGFVDGTGEANILFPLPVNTPAGFGFYAQFAAWGPYNPLGVATSDSLAIITQP